MSDIERAAFEQAVADKWSDSYKFTRFGDEDYYDEVLEGMWWGWQAGRRAISSCSEIPNSSGHASRQALEGEAIAIVNDSRVLEWYPPYNRPPAGTKLYTHSASRQALDGEPFTWVFTDVNGEAKEIAGDPVHRSPQDLRIYTPLYKHPASGVPDDEYFRALQDAFDIIQADANTERNYGSLCRIGGVLGKLKTN